MNINRRPNLAVLFDADNIVAEHARAILNEVADHGNPTLRRVYGDWTSERLKNWKAQVVNLGMNAHQLSANTSGKNASDIGMVIDAMDLLHSGRFDGFVLVSSDSDFTALANRIREHNLIVLGIGQDKTPEALRNACTQFVRIEDLATDETKPKAKPLKQAEDRLLNILDAAADDEGWATLSAAGSRVRARYPDFDPRSYGHSQLAHLVKACKGLEMRKQEQHLEIRKK